MAESDPFSPEWHVKVPTKASRLGRLLAFAGPGIMVSVGYMDPGNWGTDLQAGSSFGFALLWVILLSNLVAQYLQILSLRLGLAGDIDLAQACRRHYSPKLCAVLWILAEVAIVACDVAEVVGSAVALELLFGLPLIAGVILTGLDVLILLGVMRLGFRWIEAVVTCLVFTVSGCFLLEMILSRPDVGAALHASVIPTMPGIGSLGVALAILGATVMPHNLYLQSSTVRSRSGSLPVKESIGYATTETVLALSVAYLVNAAILVLAATAFFHTGHAVTQLQDAYQLLKPLLGGVAASAFAIALLASGQSSTITGTLAGQIVMEGFLNLRLKPWLRRLVSRGLAIVPALIGLSFYGDKGIIWLLILSQNVLSLQLPFAIGPLVQFAGDKRIMGSFASPAWLTAIGWCLCVLIAGLNLWLISTVTHWMVAVGAGVLTAVLFAWIGVSRRTTPETA